MDTKLRVSGLPSTVTKERLNVFFKNKRKQGGGPIELIEYINETKSEAEITFQSPEAVQLILSRGLTVQLDGITLKVSSVLSSHTPLSSHETDSHIQTSNVSSSVVDHHEEQKTVEYAQGASSHTVAQEECSAGSTDGENEIFVVAKVQNVDKTKKFYLLYLEDEEINSEGIIEDQLILDGLRKTLYIPFKSTQGATKFCNRSHETSSNILSATIANDADLDLYINLLSIHSGQPIMDLKHFREQILQWTEQDKLILIQQDEASSIIVVFEEISTYEELTDLSWKCAGKNFEGWLLVTAPVLRSRSALVTGLSDRIDDCLLRRYMASKRNGGGKVLDIKRENSDTAIVTYESEESLDGILHKDDHELETCKLQIQTFHQCLSKEAYTKYNKHIIQSADVMGPTFQNKANSDFNPNCNKHPRQVSGVNLTSDSKSPTPPKEGKTIPPENPDQCEVVIEKFNQCELILMKKLRLVDEIETDAEGVDIIMDVDNSKVVLRGKNEMQMMPIKMRFLETFKCLESRNITELSTPQKKFLKKEGIVTEINNKLMKMDIPGMVHHSDVGLICSCLKSFGMNKVMKEIEDFCTVESINIEAGANFILSSNTGKDFISKIQKEFSSCYVHPDFEKSSLQVIGPLEVQFKVNKRIQSFLSSNSVMETVVPFSSGKQKFAKFYMKEKLNTFETLLPAIGLSVRKESDRFVLKGLESKIPEGKEKINEIKDRIQLQEFHLDFFGIMEFLSTDEGKKKMKEAGQANSCVLELKRLAATRSTDSPKPAGKQHGSSVDPPKTPVTIGLSQQDSVIITLCQGDVLGLKAEALVHPVASSLDCGSRLSNAMIEQGYKGLKDDVKTAFPGEPNVGDVAQTLATSLPFKSVLHLICPVNDEGDKADDLEKAVYQCLKFAESRGFKSLALPAVGSAKTFQFHAVSVGNSILKALKKFLNQSSGSVKLKEVYICDMKSAMVEQLMSSYNFMFDDEMDTVSEMIPDSSGRRSTSPAPSKPGRKPAKKDFGHIKVTISLGEITKEKNDVIVTTVNKNLDLSRSKLSQCLLKHAGEDVQSQLSSNYPNGLKFGEFAETSGGNLHCKHIYYACLSRSGNGGNEHQISSLVSKMLQQASDQGATSISIPALGTGNLGYDPETSASCIMDSISEFSKKNAQSSLRTVHLVIYYKDQDIHVAFQRALTNGGSTGNEEDIGTMGRIKQNVKSLFGMGDSDSGHKQTLGSVQLSVKSGDITKEKCNAIVCGIKDSMNLEESGKVCMAIFKKCGRGLQDECDDKRDDMSSTGVAVTGSHGLPSDHIIHVSLQKFSRDWYKGTQAVLAEAESQGFTSVALPALGTGAKGANVLNLKSQILKAISEFGQSGKHTLSDIRLIIFDEKVLETFTGKTKPRSHHKERSKPSRDDPVLPKATVSQQAQIQIYYLDAKTVKVARDHLNRSCQQAFKKKTFKKENVKKFSQEKIKQLELDGPRHLVHVKVRKGSGEVEMQTFFPEKMTEVHEKLSQLVEEELKKASAAIPMAIQWQFKAGEKWKDFEKMMNVEIEHAHKDFKEGGKDTFDMTDERKRSYQLNFKKMKEYLMDSQGQRSGQKCDIRRLDKTTEQEPLPTYWDQMDESAHLKLVTLKPGCEEYKKVIGHFHNSGMTNTPVKQIERIQNKALYQQYKVKKREMEKRNPKGTKNELRLFHGTDAGTVDKVNTTGFNRSYCGKNATVHGEGVYFSQSSQYSSSYARADASGVRKMYQARVLVGESTQSSSGMKYLPDKPGTNIPYDSGHASNMYIIFHDAQAYPEYLITF